MSNVPAAPQATAKVKPFTPPALANFNAMHPGYAHRFIDTSPGNRRGDRLSYWINPSTEWEIAPYGNSGMAKNRATGTTSQDGAVHYRGLVLIRCPIAYAQARNDHYREKHNRLLKASNAMRELAQAALDAHSKDRGHKTSAFSEMEIRKGLNVVDRTALDTAQPEKVLRDLDMKAVQDLKERMERQDEDMRAMKAENDRLKAEARERAAKPSDRRTARKSFPTS